MQVRWPTIPAIVLLLLIGLGVPPSALALSCITLPDVIARMDVIVRGKITAIPANGVIELAVSRYYKGGSGPAHLQAEVPGLGQGQRMDWYSVPKVGDELVIGFVKHGDVLVNEACNLFVQLERGQEPPQEVQSLIGQGQAPDPDGQPRQGQNSHPPEGRPEQVDRPRNALMWPSGLGLLVIGLTAWTIWRRRRRETSGRRPL